MKKKPVIVLSKCIGHGHLRYDGSEVKSPFVNRLTPYVDFITVCPEVGIGLSVPREAIRMIIKDNKKRLVASKSGYDVTDRMLEFSNNFATSLLDKSIHGFILKGRSPTCGIKDVKFYKKAGKVPMLGKNETGIFANHMKETFSSVLIEDEGRLTNYNIREHFLTSIFTFFNFDRVIEENKMKTLIDFHTKNKYLLMAYNQQKQKTLGKIVANTDKKPTKDIIIEYRKSLYDALSKPLRRGSNINMLMHLFGYFKNDLAKEEKAYFLDLLSQYSQKKIPFSVPISIIYSWVIRFKEPYLTNQTIFNPFPKEILDVTDSGKGID